MVYRSVRKSRRADTTGAGMGLTVVLYAPARGLSAPAYLRLAAVLAPSLLDSTRCVLTIHAKLRFSVDLTFTRIHL